MEALLAEHKESGRFCHGEAPTLADIGLVTQVTPARTFGGDLAPYPRVMRIYDTVMAIPAFADATRRNNPTRSSQCDASAEESSSALRTEGGMRYRLAKCQSAKASLE